MDVSTIYSVARTLTGTDSNGLTDANAQVFLRLTYRDLVNCIKTQVNEDFFYDEWVANLVSGQREYTLPARTSLVAGCNKVKGISILTASTETAFTKCRESDLGALPEDLSRYSSEQSSREPLYVISDNSVFIYPSPSENITGGLKIYGIADPIDPSTGGTEASVKIPLEHHEALCHGIAYWHFTSQQRTDRALESKARYDEAKRYMISELSDRTVSPAESTLPNLTALQ